MISDRDGLAAYRLLEFPNETDQSWPISERDQALISYLRVPRDADNGAGAKKKIAA
jgi:hypothetical protein